jgi:CheY-like chemotaxis protein
MTTVLLVEDEEKLRENIAELLHLYGHVVEQATNGQEALYRLKQIQPDIIICDVMMPQMDGFTFLHTIKQNLSFRHIPVILLTAKVAREDRIAGLKQGAIDYLTKPFLKEELLLKVKNHVQLKTDVTAIICQKEGEKAVLTVQFVKRVTELLEAHYSQKDYQLSTLADGLGMSRSAVQRNLKRYFSKNFLELLKEFRLRKSADYLLNTDLSLERIAGQCGFGSQSYFSSSFKTAFACSPLRYRTENQFLR